MNKIIVGVDGSDQGKKALAMAIELAAKMETTLTVVHGVLPAFMPPEAFGVTTGGVDPSLRDQAKVLAKAAVSQARAAGVNATARIEVGAPPEVICSVADSEDADMIVIGSRGHGAFREFVLGSISNRVSHIAHRPVLVVH